MTKKPMPKAVLARPKIIVEYEALYEVPDIFDRTYRAAITKQEKYTRLPSRTALEAKVDAWHVKELQREVLVIKGGPTLELWGITVTKVTVNQRARTVDREELFVL